MNTPFCFGILVGLFIAAFLNVMPFSDAAKYRSAIEECEKSIPRDQHCRIIGVKE